MTAQVLAVLAKPFDKTKAYTIPEPESVYGAYGFPYESDLSLTGGVVEVGIATKPFVTKGSETPAHKAFPGLLVNAFNFGITLFDTVDPIEQKSQSGAGEISVDDPNDLLATASISYSWDHRLIEIYRGLEGSDFASFTKVASLLSAAIQSTSDESKTIALRNAQQLLYRQPLRKAVYAGTGGAEGDQTIAGILKPNAFGEVFWCPLIIVNSGKWIMQWNDGPVESVDGLFDGGSPLAFTANYGTWADLDAATLIPGEYATCNALGMVRAGGPPAFGFRLNGKGDKTNGVYVNKRADIVRRIVTTRGSQPLNDPNELDTSSFTTFNTAQSAATGYYCFSDNPSIGDFLDEFLAGAAGLWYMSLLGAFTLLSLAEPAVSADYTLDHARGQIISVREGNWLPPRFIINMGYKKNNGPQTPAELADGLSDTEITEYGQLWRISPYMSESIRAEFPNSRIVDIEGYFVAQSTAKTEADRQGILLSKDRRVWIVEAKIDPFLPLIGKTFDIKNFNKHRFGTSKKMLCIGIGSMNAGVNTSLILWADTEPGIGG